MGHNTCKSMGRVLCVERRYSVGESGACPHTGVCPHVSVYYNKALPGE